MHLACKASLVTFTASARVLCGGLGSSYVCSAKSSNDWNGASPTFAQKEILGEVKKYLDLPKDDPSREEFVLNLRNGINKWVAKYRRSDFTGKQSFGYATVVNVTHPRALRRRFSI